MFTAHAIFEDRIFCIYVGEINIRLRPKILGILIAVINNGALYAGFL